MADFELEKGTLATPIDTGSSLGNGDNTSAVWNNSDNVTFVNAWLRVYFDTTAPSPGALIAELWYLPSDGEGTPDYPETDATDNAQAALKVGVFETINPSLSTAESLVIRRIAVEPGNGTWLIHNISGQTFNSTWQLDLVPYKWVTV